MLGGNSYLFGDKQNPQIFYGNFKKKSPNIIFCRLFLSHMLKSIQKSYSQNAKFKYTFSFFFQQSENLQISTLQLMF